jgi:hypothetical protein
MKIPTDMIEAAISFCPAIFYFMVFDIPNPEGFVS